ncbi:hypothetical protein FMM68_00270 [Lachnospiraceae bacterium MD329]|nr:hypothetical protein [Lachnospiraceae bacterium MD329]
MNKKRKNLIILITIMLLIPTIYLLINIVYSKYISYPKWVKNYLQNKYSENMIITDTYMSDFGYCAVVSPETEPDLKFSVRGKYIDTYLERALEYEAEQKFNNIYPEYTCVAQMFGYESITTPFEELYTLYEKHNRPANWNEIPEYIRLERLRINTNQYIDEELVNNIVNTILLSDVKTSIIEIYDGRQQHIFRFDTINNAFMPN